VKKFIFFIIVLLVVSKTNSQLANSMAFPSPNNTFLGAAGTGGSGSGVDVDLYTGTALVNIPITSLASNSLSIPVSLSYTGGRGIKVQDYASFVGLGWQLNAGGAISRVVRGFPDEQPNGYLGTGTLPSGAIGTGGQWGKVVATNLKNNTPLTSGLSSTQYPALIGSNSTPPTADGEPDIFYVKTPFFSFQFTFDENGNPVYPNNTGIKITTNNFYNSTNYANSSFIVTDDKGNQYYFGSSTASVETTTAKIYSNTVTTTFPTTWYLDKIVTYNSKETVTFAYQSYFNSDSYLHYRSAYTVNFCNSSTNTDTVSIVTTVNQPKFLTKINSSLGEVDFNYTTSGRLDDPSSVILSSVALKGLNPTNTSSPTLLQTFNFNYSYFNATSYVYLQVLNSRLELNNITITDNTSTTPIPITYRTFGYYTAQSLPSRSDMTAIDYFGYYTSPGSNQYNQPHASNSTYAMAGILTSVTDISGLTNTISYQLNNYSSSNITIGGLRVSQITQSLPTGGNLTTSYQYVDNSGNSSGQILSSSYNTNSISSTCSNCANGIIIQYLSESPSNFYDLNGNFIGYSSVKVVQPNGGYAIYSFSNFTNSGGINFNDTLKYMLSPLSNTPDITPSISLAYKRGILIDKSVYNSTGKIISEDKTPLTAFSSLTSPVTKSSWGLKWYGSSFTVGGCAFAFYVNPEYWTYIENFLPTQTIHTDYDANGNAVSTTTNMTYVTGNSVAQNNNRLTKSITTVDSKGNTHKQTFYYPGDSNIPLTTTAENSAIAGMIVSNNIGSPIHIADSSNGAIRETHSSYTSVAYGGGTRVYLTSVSGYATSGRALIKQQTFTYNSATSNVTSITELGGKTVSILYGYNNTYPVAKIAGTDFNTVISHVDTSVLNTGTEAQIETQLGNLRAAFAGNNSVQVTTNTYTPLIGKISQTTPNGYTMYYEYDGFGRLLDTKDKDGNIIKASQYHYIGQ
jgi:YD repeat-containing protein